MDKNVARKDRFRAGFQLAAKPLSELKLDRAKRHAYNFAKPLTAFGNLCHYKRGGAAWRP